MATHSEETKAAVMAALLAGQSVNSVAKEYKLPVGTVKSWKSRGVAEKATVKKADRIGELLLEYLEENLTTLKEQARIFRTETWLMKQNASDVAVLHGVLTDKSIRLLEAMSKNVPDNN